MAQHPCDNSQPIRENQQADNQQDLVPASSGPEETSARETSAREECGSDKNEATDLCKKVPTNVSEQEEDSRSCSLKNILNENDTLRQTIQDLIQDFQSGKLLHKLDSAVEKSEEAFSHCNNALQQELKALPMTHEHENSCHDLYTDKLHRINVLREDKNKCQAQITDVNKEIQVRNIFRGKYKQLEVEEQILRARCDVLKATHSEIDQKLQNEEDWRSKYYALREQTNLLREEHDAVAQKIWASSKELKNLSAIKANYKTLKAENAFLNEQNATLQAEMEHLSKKMFKQRALEEENNAIRAENKVLSKENSDLKHKVYRFRSTIKDKKFLAIMSDSLEREKEAIISENSILHKKLLRLERKMDKDKALERTEIGKAFQADSPGLQADQESATTWDDLSRDTLDHINALRRVNAHLQKHIHVMKRRLQNRAISKGECKHLEAQKKVLQTQCIILNKTRSDIYEILQNKESWRSKCKELKRETEALQESNHKLFQEIQSLNEDLGNLGAFKAEYNAMLAENMIRVAKNVTLEKDVGQLRMRLSEAEGQESSCSVTPAEGDALTNQNSDVKHQLIELSPRGEQALAFINRSVRLERDILSRQNEALHGQVHKLTRILEGANAPEAH